MSISITPRSNNKLLHHIKCCDDLNKLFRLFVALILFCAIPDTYAQNDTNRSKPNSQYKDFFQQYQKLSTQGQKSLNYRLLLQQSEQQLSANNTLSDMTSDQDLTFNYLWMLQHQSQYNHKQGGAAVGKLLRIGAKALYKIYTSGKADYSTLNTDTYSSSLSELDYRLRLSSSKIKLGLEYQF